ncbi:hypothetical protein [Paenibacillus aceti]|uniref:Uncharacterized protein n=1 Tax=Paenibacillus aceti TaxID=1820010 RepID=A0ABQ1VPL0_9BACL|nr:hypothetical protein [Paenibacillus aceti]GGF86761.1 hypothetical protein GCM10010913_05320 [Paenibacillus aceti]
MINWKIYNQNNPPEVGKAFLVHRIDGSVFSAILLFDVKHAQLYWEQKDSITLINNVTHYAELNLPDPTEGFDWFTGEE